MRNRQATPRPFAAEHAHLELADFGSAEGAERVLDFVARHWEHAAPGTRRKVLSTLSSYFDWAVRFERVTANPYAVSTALAGAESSGMRTRPTASAA